MDERPDQQQPSPQQGPPQTSERPDLNGKTAFRKKRIALTVFGIIVLIGAISAAVYAQYAKNHISTDDAFIEATTVAISPKVAGTVIAVHVQDNQAVKKGDPLVEIDPSVFETRVSDAEAALESARSGLAEARVQAEVARTQMSQRQAGVGATQAALELARVTLQQAETDLKRIKALYDQQAIPQERYDNAVTAQRVATAQQAAAKQRLREAQAALKTQRALIEQAESAIPTKKALVAQREAQLEASRLDLGYTKLTAPFDGMITKKSVDPGTEARVGQPLMFLVNLSDIWVMANYKETQLDRVRPGQPVTIEVDSYPGLELKGTVHSIMSGTGSVFSLFPPENATGNYVKVVQRIPVRIDIGPHQDDTGRVLRAGMSVVPTIHTTGVK
jgi:membrane fusion protein (multidrug efflux system)